MNAIESRRVAVIGVADRRPATLQDFLDALAAGRALRPDRTDRQRGEGRPGLSRPRRGALGGKRRRRHRCVLNRFVNSHCEAPSLNPRRSVCSTSTSRSRSWPTYPPLLNVALEASNEPATLLGVIGCELTHVSWWAFPTDAPRSPWRQGITGVARCGGYGGSWVEVR